jgi:hypothetical protein
VKCESAIFIHIASVIHIHGLGFVLILDNMVNSQEAINCTSWRVGKIVSRDIQHTTVDPDTSKTKCVGYAHKGY